MPATSSFVSPASTSAGYAIRPAVPADLPGIARVHVDSWRTTYQGIVSDAFLDGLSYERSEARNRSLMERPDAPPHVFVATAPNGAVVGFAMGGPTRSDDAQFTGELYGIYLLKEQQGHGLGRGLVRAMARSLAGDGHRSLIVWVLAANPSRNFYEALGGQYHRAQNITLGGQELAEVAYGWPDITVLLNS
jgi:L-amino acid N-acyltransferase YncA